MCEDTTQYCVCNDIYEVNNPKLEVKVLTFNEITGEPLFGTEVTMSSLKNTALESQIKSLADNNLYDDYQVDFSDQYKVVATKEKYTMGNVEFGTPGPFVDTIIEAKVYLRPAVDLEVKTFDKVSGDPLNGVEVSLVEVKEDKLLSTEVEAFGHEYDYDINWKKRYMIIASKEGYTPDTTYVSTETIRGFASLRSNPEYNKALTKRRISSIDNYFNNWVAPSGKTLQNFKDRIVVTESPLGDQEACRGCYKKSAITDVDAAKDRRVEVINVTITKNPCQVK